MKTNFAKLRRERDYRVFSTRSGVALIITLIMLSVITVMAVAFLALSRRERSAVVRSADAIDAEFMANSGAERAKAEILANIITYSNYVGPGLLVSGARTNVVRGPGDIPDFFEDPRDGTNDNNDRAVIAQLRQDAHPPVFVGRSRDPRFYLDINRNGR